MAARRHHYVPRFYLKGFTTEGTEDGRLFVVDQRTGKTWQSTPIGAAHERDFYRIEGEERNALEDLLAGIEANAATGRPTRRPRRKSRSLGGRSRSR